MSSSILSKGRAEAAVTAEPAAPAATPRVSVVLPAYNEEESIGPMAAAIHDAMRAGSIADYEVIFVDDGSKDGTVAAIKAERAKDPRVRLISFKRNAGQTAALEAGIKRSRGAIIVTLDCDLQNDPSDIPRLVAKVGEFDCVCGFRENRGEGDSIVRIVSSRIANFVRDAVAKDGIKDSGCCFRAFKREAVANVKLFRGMHRFLPTLMKLEGFTVAEIPVKHNPRRFGKSKYGILNRVFAASYDLFAVRWMQSRKIRWEIGEES
jgi:glycosyltransferase involved in cell wall biosynthesis